MLKNVLLNQIFPKYNLDKHSFLDCQSIVKGLLNSTYVISLRENGKIKKYLLQKINTNAFKNPDELMENIINITDYAKTKLNESNRFIEVNHTIDNEPYLKLVNKDCYRLMSFIDHCHSYDNTMNLSIHYEAGKIIGNFVNLFLDYDGEKLHETIKNFHHTPKRYDTFLNSLAKCDEHKLKECEEEISFFINNSYIKDLIQSLIDDNKMPIRVTHNDTKLANMLFFDNTNLGNCLIDLDTVMPGCVCLDFGDYVRSACNQTVEDDPDLSKVIFNKDAFLNVSKGFLDTSSKNLTQIEIDNLVNGCIVITYEIALRFLTDYLDGNIYFKTIYNTHNLVRARNQIKLCKQIIELKEELEQTIKN